jgi:SEC-C motif
MEYDTTMNRLDNIKLIDNRTCGACFACCKILNIYSETLKKEADVLCPNYQHGMGCTIYDQRPEQCRQWYCVWRFDDVLPHDFSPDKINIAFCLEKSPRHPAKNIIVARAYEAEYEIAFATEKAQRAFDLLIAAGHEVWLSNGVLKAPIEKGKPLPTFKPDQPHEDKKAETPRNAPCQCGSGKRYKYCCGKM